ncbi:MAG: hypothetical protein AABW84_02600 [Nanoarchaeota archaeon]
MIKKNIDKSHNVIWLIGISVLLLVGVNLLFFFSEITASSYNSFGPVTGSAVFTCTYTFDGVHCSDGSDYMIAELGCPVNTNIICTNECEIERSKTNDGRLCQTYCTNYCLSSEDIQKLKETAVHLI